MVGPEQSVQTPTQNKKWNAKKRYLVLLLDASVALDAVAQFAVVLLAAVDLTVVVDAVAETSVGFGEVEKRPGRPA